MYVIENSLYNKCIKNKEICIKICENLQNNNECIEYCKNEYNIKIISEIGATNT